MTEPTKPAQDEAKEVSTRLRLPAALHDALVRQAGLATAKEGRRVSSHALMLRYLQEGLRRDQTPEGTTPPTPGDDDIIFDGNAVSLDWPEEQ